MLVDGGFFLVRRRRLIGNATPAEVAKSLHKMCLAHIKNLLAGKTLVGLNGRREETISAEQMNALKQALPQVEIITDPDVPIIPFT